MSLFNHKSEDADCYYCPKCGEQMEFADEAKNILVCRKCGENMSLDRYGYSNDEDGDSLCPASEEMTGSSDEAGEFSGELGDAGEVGDAGADVE